MPGSNTACNLWWGFKNGYTKEVDVQYAIDYVRDDGSQANFSTRANLKPGVNELPEFKIVGRKLLRVKAEIVINTDTRAKIDREKAAKAEEEVRKREEAERLAAQTAEEERRKVAEQQEYWRTHPNEYRAYLREQEEMNRRSEEQREVWEERRRVERLAEERRQEREEENRRMQEAGEEARRAQQEAREDRMNQLILDSARGVGQAITDGAQRVNDAKMQRIQQENQAREDRRQAQAERNRIESEDRRQREETQRAERQRVAKLEEDRRAEETRRREDQERKRQEAEKAEREKQAKLDAEKEKQRLDSGRYLPGSQLDHCLKTFYGEKNQWLYQENVCSESIYVTMKSVKKYGYSGSLKLVPGKAESTTHTKKEVDALGGFKYAICPVGYYPVDARDDFWHDAMSQYRCRKEL